MNVLHQPMSGPPGGPTPRPRTIRAVCFDLDDTLYPQAIWLSGAWRAVAEAAARSTAAGPPVDADALLAELELIAAFGTDGGQIIDRALYRLGAAHVPVEPLVAAFRAHTPEMLEPYSGVPTALERLGTRVPLGLISDGDPAIQAAKLAALHLEPRFSVIVWSDDHGRAHRKPDPLPFQLAAQGLGARPDTVVYVGDRPAKDVAGAVGAGMHSMRVHTGEWVDAPDDDRALGSYANVLDAIAAIHRLLDDQPGD